MTFQWKAPFNRKSILMLLASIAPLVAYGLAHNAFAPSWQGPLTGTLGAYAAIMMYVHHAVTPDVEDPGVMGAGGGTAQDTTLPLFNATKSAADNTTKLAP